MTGAPIHALARAALSWVFVYSGQDVLRHPEKPANTARPMLTALRSHAPAPLPGDVTLIRGNAATQVAAGLALAAGIRPRAAALVLAGSLIPTTAAGHAFWTHEDPAQRVNQRNHFNKNLGLFGGLLLVILTGGKGGRS